MKPEAKSNTQSEIRKRVPYNLTLSLKPKNVAFQNPMEFPLLAQNYSVKRYSENLHVSKWTRFLGPFSSARNAVRAPDMTLNIWGLRETTVMGNDVAGYLKTK